MSKVENLRKAEDGDCTELRNRKTMGGAFVEIGRKVMVEKEERCSSKTSNGR